MAYADTPRYVTMFRRYDNTQGAMGPTEFHNFWMSFDSNQDLFIEEGEFVEVWDALFDDVLDLHS
ncbi:uncharacterized protein LOC132548974 [Ylistrum balloti]|uniref:uncharacterized protein LOC132548974 n=1 Tax=Ylistrum balloti TaxID=509963 RepID=UPI0029059F30|nr:uncharacterized protein LOC132548974 [Ylistrum balloti]